MDNMMFIQNHDIDENFILTKPYVFIKGYAHAKKLRYTLQALPLLKIIHKNQYRRQRVSLHLHDHSEIFRVPYCAHPLRMVAYLIALGLPISAKEEDILYTCCLLHDVLEDTEFFGTGGKKMTDTYGFPEEVLAVIKLLSKRSGATATELDSYFENIKTSRIALIIKLVDRADNVSDLYTMTPVKVKKYIEETRKYVVPLTSYGKSVYPEFSNAFWLIKNKIVGLIETAEAISKIYESSSPLQNNKNNDN